MSKLNLVREQGKEYAIGSKSIKSRNIIMNAFHKEVIKQILLGNKVLLPGDISIEIIKHEYAPSSFLVKKQPRLGFNYKVLFVYHKLKRKKVKFTTSPSLEKKLMSVLKNTNFEFRLVDNGYQ